MTEPIRILQFNIRGIISKDTQKYKCPRLNNILQTKRIDVVLLQEWSATVRENTFRPKNNLENTKPKTNFPSHYFPNYKIHYHSTECAIMYHKELCVTPLPEPLIDNTYRNLDRKLQICGIILHTGSIDYNIYSVYKTKNANPSDIFNIQHDRI